MSGYQKALSVLLALGFSLFLAGSFAFEAKMPILGTILGGWAVCSFLSTLLVLRREEQRKKEEDQRRYQ